MSVEKCPSTRRFIRERERKRERERGRERVKPSIKQIKLIIMK